MILHIVPDDKFIDMAYNMFEKATPNNNEFMVVTRQKKFKYIKTTPITKITRKAILGKEFENILKNYEFVVLHTLSNVTKKLVVNSSSNVKFLWVGWGFDYYCYVDKKLLLEKTYILKEKLIKERNFFGKNILRQLKNTVEYYTIYYGIKNTTKVMDKIDYFAPVLYEDYLLVKNQHLEFKPKYIDWNYGTLEEDLVKEELHISGTNILLGNSASYENNHIEAIDLLDRLELEGRKIICPLSYGSKDYADRIIAYGTKKLSLTFEPLKSFMEIDQYNKIISSCSVVIMNHIRQQAVGNIVIMMYFGAKIFLNKENPVYTFFKKNGAVIFCMEELTNEQVNNELTEEEKVINRELLKKHWSQKTMLEKTQNLIQTMSNTNA